MTDRPSSDESFTSVRAAREDAIQDLRNLRFVGPATADTLVDGSITAADIRDQSVSFLQLVDVGVDPGVAANLRREFSLPWSTEPTRGARLQRRAQHVRHLRDDERSWIDESGAGAGSTEADSTGATPDGSGSATDAERAWRRRAQSSSRSAQDASDSQPAMNETRTTRRTTTVAERAAPLDPSDLTVPELEEALESLDDPDALAAVQRAERASDDRATANDAIESRLRAVGADPAEVRAHGSSHPPPGGEVGGRDRSEQGPTAVASLTAPSNTAVIDGLDDRLDGSLAELRDTLADAEEAGRRYASDLRALEIADSRQLSIALLLGVTSFSLATVLVSPMHPAIGLPGSVLPLFLVTAVAGVISLPLRWWEAAGGYGLAHLTGLLGLVSVGLVAAGTVGTVSLGTALLTLPVYAVVAAALLVTTEASRRD